MTADEKLLPLLRDNQTGVVVECLPRHVVAYLRKRGRDGAFLFSFINPQAEA